MERRTLLAFGIIGVPSIVLGLYEKRVWPGRSSDFNFWSLPPEVGVLYDIQYESALSEIDVDGLLRRLEGKGVLIEGEFNLARIASTMGRDSIIEFDRNMYTESELTLYALVARLRSQSLLRFLG